MWSLIFDIYIIVITFQCCFNISRKKFCGIDSLKIHLSREMFFCLVFYFNTPYLFAISERLLVYLRKFSQKTILIPTDSPMLQRSSLNSQGWKITMEIKKLNSLWIFHDTMLGQFLSLAYIPLPMWIWGIHKKMPSIHDT